MLWEKCIDIAVTFEMGNIYAHVGIPLITDSCRFEYLYQHLPILAYILLRAETSLQYTCSLINDGCWGI